jgi:S-adenosylmethionine:tRNA ribosyltransferase-isomerase
MRPEDFDYQLPRGQIAQRPLERRDASRLLRVDRVGGNFEDHRFEDLPSLLHGNELMILNDARVIPARLFGRRVGVHAQTPSEQAREAPLSGRVEVFLTRRVDSNTWETLVRPGRKMRIGERVQFGEGKLEGEVIGKADLGARIVRFSSHDSHTIEEHFESLGHVPLPPYIDRSDESSDRERYQTVFAKTPGAVAAPTAGLHFTPEMLDAVRQRGVEICEITLNVGLGTFQPIHSETLEGHVMHAESYEISESAAGRINAAKSAGRPVLAVGTTVVRAVEAAALRSSQLGRLETVQSGAADARLFIYPGFCFRVVDALLTNFHLPQSTLLALVAAFAGRENVLRAYNHAVKSGYRFYSYGDCMLIR